MTLAPGLKWAGVSALILLFFAFGVARANGAEERKITVVFRYDDYSSFSPTDLEIRLIDAFRDHKVPCTIGVIPSACQDVHSPIPQSGIPLSSEKAAILKEAERAGIVEIALHGYTHQDLGTGVRGQHTEFAGGPYDAQLRRIEDGKQLLEGMMGEEVKVFVPPWETYDLSTVRALGKAGFRYLSGSKKGVSEDSSLLRFLPSTCGLQDLRTAIQFARSIPDNQTVVVVLFHAYDFREADPKRGKLAFRDFADLLAWVSSQKDISTLTIGQAAELVRDPGSHRFAAYSAFASSWLHRLSPPFLDRMYSEKVYPSPETLRRLSSRGRFLIALFYITVLSMSIAGAHWIGCFLFFRASILVPIAKHGGVVLLVLFSAYAFRTLEIYYRAAMVLTCLLGMCIGVWGCSYNAKRRSDGQSRRGLP